MTTGILTLSKHNSGANPASYLSLLVNLQPKLQYFTLPGLFHMESMEWRVEADGFHGMADGFHGMADGFHGLSRWIPYHSMEFPDGILFSQWSPYGIHGIHME